MIGGLQDLQQLQRMTNSQPQTHLYLFSVYILWPIRINFYVRYNILIGHK